MRCKVFDVFARNCMLPTRTYKSNFMPQSASQKLLCRQLDTNNVTQNIDVDVQVSNDLTLTRRQTASIERPTTKTGYIIFVGMIHPPIHSSPSENTKVFSSSPSLPFSVLAKHQG